MSGGEIVPVTKALRAAKRGLGESSSVKEQLAEIAKDSPAMKEAAEKYARRLAIKQGILLAIYRPLARWAGVSRDYFESESGFAEDMSRKVAHIPDEHLTAPPPSVVVPAMQGLAYSLDEPDLKEMYLNLLRTATDDRTGDQAHPSFAEIIKQLSAREATLLTDVLGMGSIPIARVTRKAREVIGSELVNNHVVAFEDPDDDELVEEPSFAVWADNWVRLGLIEIDYTRKLVGDDRYDWVQRTPEFERAVAGDERGRGGITFDKGILRPTDFGQRFYAAVRQDVTETVNGAGDEQPS